MRLPSVCLGRRSQSQNTNQEIVQPWFRSINHVGCVLKDQDEAPTRSRLILCFLDFKSPSLAALFQFAELGGSGNRLLSVDLTKPFISTCVLSSQSAESACLVTDFSDWSSASPLAVYADPIKPSVFWLQSRPACSPQRSPVQPWV